MDEPGDTELLVGLAALVVALGVATAAFLRRRPGRVATAGAEGFGLSKVTVRWFQRHWRRNGVGFRDSVGYERVPPPGRRRVTFVGDSFTAGHGVADVEARFANRLRATHPAWDVQVFAENGWDTADETAAVADATAHGVVLDVVVLVYTLNDVADLLPAWTAAERRLFATPPPWPVRHSFFLSTLRARWLAATEPVVADYFGLVRDAADGPVWTTQVARLRGLRDDLVAAHGGRLLAVTFPFLHVLGPDYPFAAMHRALDACWRDLGVPHLDLLPVFAGRRPADVVVNARDPHPNAAAHALAADAIGPFVERAIDGR